MLTWVCENGHEGAGPALPYECPLGWCGAACTAYGPGSGKANRDRRGVPA